MATMWTPEEEQKRKARLEQLRNTPDLPTGTMANLPSGIKQTVAQQADYIKRRGILGAGQAVASGAADVGKLALFGTEGLQQATPPPPAVKPTTSVPSAGLRQDIPGVTPKVLTDYQNRVDAMRKGQEYLKAYSPEQAAKIAPAQVPAAPAQAIRSDMEKPAWYNTAYVGGKTVKTPGMSVGAYEKLKADYERWKQGKPVDVEAELMKKASDLSVSPAVRKAATDRLKEMKTERMAEAGIAGEVKKEEVKGEATVKAAAETAKGLAGKAQLDKEGLVESAKAKAEAEVTKAKWQNQFDKSKNDIKALEAISSSENAPPEIVEKALQRLIELGGLTQGTTKKQAPTQRPKSREEAIALAQAEGRPGVKYNGEIIMF